MVHYNIQVNKQTSQTKPGHPHVLTTSFIIDSQETVEFYNAFQSRARIENKISRLEMVFGRILTIN